MILLSPSRKYRPTKQILALSTDFLQRLCEPVAAIFLVQEPGEKTYGYGVRFTPGKLIAEILLRFISKPIWHGAHKRISSDRDPFVYWLYALYAAGAGTDLGFIIPRSQSGLSRCEHVANG